jgi:hypothetical protein
VGELITSTHQASPELSALAPGVNIFCSVPRTKKCVLALPTSPPPSGHWSDLTAARSPSLGSGEAFARTGAERTWVREHRTGAKTKPEPRIGGRGHQLK